MKRLLLLSFLALAATVRAAFDPSAYPPPVPPLVARAPDPGAWTIQVQLPVPAAPSAPADAAAPKPHQLVQIQSAQAGGLKRDVLAYLDGATLELWYADGMLLKPAGPGQPVMVVDLAAQARLDKDERGDPVLAAGFPGLGWITLARFDQVALFQREPCYHYVLKPGDGGGNGSGAEAWIAAKTGLPVACQRDGLLYVYTFGDGPRSLALPPAYAEARAAYAKIQDRRRQLEKDLGK